MTVFAFAQRPPLPYNVLFAQRPYLLYSMSPRTRPHHSRYETIKSSFHSPSCVNTNRFLLLFPLPLPLLGHSCHLYNVACLLFARSFHPYFLFLLLLLHQLPPPLFLPSPLTLITLSKDLPSLVCLLPLFLVILPFPISNSIFFDVHYPPSILPPFLESSPFLPHP